MKMGCLKLAMLLLIGLALVSPGISADTEQSLTVTVTFTDVIALTLDDNLTPLSISPTDLASWMGVPAEMYRDLGWFGTSIIALTEFWVGVCYDVSSSKYGAGPAMGGYPFDYDPLILTDYTGTYFSGGAPPEPANMIDYIPDCSSTELDILAYAPFFAGTNNADTAGESYDFDLSLDLAGLGDRAAAEVLTFTVWVKVHDPTL